MREDIKKRMDESAKEDRERFFAVADKLIFQPKFKDLLEEIKNIKQQWRDMTKLEDYPNIDFPLPLPEWFPEVKFVSNWKKNLFIENEIRRHNETKYTN